VKAIAILLLASCWSQPAPVEPPRPALHPASPLVAQIEAHPLELTMATLHDFAISFVVTNQSSGAVDTEMSRSELMIDGKPSMQWGAAVGNGAVDPEWEALAPQHSIRREFRFGEHLFFKPGDYTLVLVVGSASSKPLHVHVAP
jgi:hypothetical protein